MGTPHEPAQHPTDIFDAGYSTSIFDANNHQSQLTFFRHDYDNLGSQVNLATTAYLETLDLPRAGGAPWEPRGGSPAPELPSCLMVRDATPAVAHAVRR